MYADPDGNVAITLSIICMSMAVGAGIGAGAALIATAIAFTGGGAGAFFLMTGKVALGGLKIAAVAGATAGVFRAGQTAINGGSIGDVEKSLATGFADGFFAGSLYAAGTMILSASLFRSSNLFNNGCGWSSGKWRGGYQTPKTPGINIATFMGGPNGGRSFGADLDIYNGLHLHFKWAEKRTKVKNKFFTQ